MLNNHQSGSADSGLGTVGRDSDVTHLGGNMANGRRQSADSGFVEYDFLFPNGIMISKECDRRSTLSDVRASIWEDVCTKPGAYLLNSPDHYVFVGRTADNTERQFHEQSRLSDLALVTPLLEISEPIASRDLKELFNNIGEAIGIPIHKLEQTVNKYPELRLWRLELLHVCREFARMRERKSDEEKLLFFFPPKMDLNQELPLSTERKILKAENIIPEVHVYLVEQTEKYKFTVQVLTTDTPTGVIEAAVEARCEARGHGSEETRRRVSMAGQVYTLKVCGREEYMLKQCCIHAYEYVRDCINNSEVPKFQIVSRENLTNQLPSNTCVMLQQEPPPLPEPGALAKSPGTILSWDIPYDIKYSIRVLTQPGRKSTHIDSPMYVQAQLFLGEDELCKPVTTSKLGFKQWWTFDIAIQSLPRNTRLCFVTFARRKGEVEKSLNWVNMQVFDSEGRLVTGEQTLQVFDFPDSKNVKQYPHGTPGSNYWETTAEDRLTVEVRSPWSKQVIHPPESYIDTIIRRERTYSKTTHDPIPFAGFDALVSKDPLHKMTTDEKRFLWNNRHKARDYSQKLLPKLVQSVDWKDRNQVIELHDLLVGGGSGQEDLAEQMTLATALQLLRPGCQDDKMRRLAVTWLRKHLDVAHIELYMLQLVQILKFESYQSNEFARFLLEKALLHQRIGHKLFWLLRAELDNPVSRCRFAVLLEAYCLHCGTDILEQRKREVAALKQFSSVTTAVKNKDLTAAQANAVFTEWLSQSTTSVVEETPSLMHPSVMLGQLVDAECRVLGSKMKPVMLSYTNKNDPSSDPADQRRVKYIVKNGDDLRQDELVVQMLRVMKMLWKYCASDFRPVIYDCMALNSSLGIIEVVQKATTLCEIQQETKKGATDSTGLHEWLYQNTKDNIGFPKAVEHFTQSCAGFCVATFLLGVGDRHSDNIMVTEAGDIFNIDFGHFMNHKKSKANIKRERTPFILTNDFVNIITRPAFESFLFLCFEAYMTIRKNSDLILTLLSLMMYADLPELSEEKDIQYCRECLGVDQGEQEAVKMFYGKIMQSYKGQWSTKINWFFHAFNRNLKANSSS